MGKDDSGSTQSDRETLERLKGKILGLLVRRGVQAADTSWAHYDL